MDQLHTIYSNLKRDYDAHAIDIADIATITSYCLAKLTTEANTINLGTINGKSYSAFQYSNKLSRPYLPDIFMGNPESFAADWQSILSKIDTYDMCINEDPGTINATLYTAIMSFAICYDLWKTSSRKTPGTYFEVILGSLLGKILPDCTRSKHIPLPGYAESVSTDIVFMKHDGNHALVIPAKITTRERIVQPYAHQAILNSVFGPDHYRSVLVCVSETQRDGPNNVKEICVPGTIRLFQEHLAKLSGIYYLDPPTRYIQDDLTSILNVSSLGYFLASGIKSILS